jgi:hypothetical protein
MLHQSAWATEAKLGILYYAWSITGTRDLLIDIKPKTVVTGFTETHENKKKSINFRYKIQILKFGRKK